MMRALMTKTLFVLSILLSAKALARVVKTYAWIASMGGYGRMKSVRSLVVAGFVIFLSATVHAKTLLLSADAPASKAGLSAGTSALKAIPPVGTYALTSSAELLTAEDGDTVTVVAPDGGKFDFQITNVVITARGNVYVSGDDVVNQGRLTLSVSPSYQLTGRADLGEKRVMFGEENGNASMTFMDEAGLQYMQSQDDGIAPPVDITDDSDKPALERSSPQAADSTAIVLSADAAKQSERFGDLNAALSDDQRMWFPNQGISQPEQSVQPLSKIGSAILIKDGLRQIAPALHLSGTAIDQSRLESVHQTGRGPTISRFHQTFRGRDVFGRHVNVLTKPNGEVVALSGTFAPQKPVTTSTQKLGQAESAYELDARAAIVSAFSDLGGHMDPSELKPTGEKSGFSIFAFSPSQEDLRLQGSPRAKALYYAFENRFIPAWHVELEAFSHEREEDYAFGYVISAVDGEVLFKQNLRSHAFYEYRVFADADGRHTPMDSPLGNVATPAPSLDPDDDDPRIPVEQNLITLDHAGISTGDPWLNDGAIETVGNNVDAYLDIRGKNGRDHPRDIRATAQGRSFDYLATADIEPKTAEARSAAVVNLFYTNNFLHDWWYDSGFDEAAGNGQTDNYGRGGEEGDPILAEAQDRSGRNNANMYTPSDGFSARMQMYLNDGPEEEHWLAVDTLGTLSTGIGLFEPRSFDITGTVVIAEPAYGCSTLTNSEAVQGKIVLIYGGQCSPTPKLSNAEEAGALAVILAASKLGRQAPTLTGDSANSMPILTLSYDDGQALRDAVAANPLSATLFKYKDFDRDGTMGNGIIAHEYFHFVSNRLTSLGNNQGRSLGEGWSDFATLMLNVRHEDRYLAGNSEWGMPYSVGSYWTGGRYFGIRRAPYSTSKSIYPLTFKHIENGVPLPTDTGVPLRDTAWNAETHNSGEIWCNILWNIYAEYLNDENLSFTEAQRRMSDYLIASIKMTPNEPTFTEARDAFLAVVKATDHQDYERAIRVFADYGMGIGALAPHRFSNDHSGVVESYVAFASEFSISNVELGKDRRHKRSHSRDSKRSNTDCDQDGVLDIGETQILTVTIENNGNRPFPKRMEGKLSVQTDGLELANRGNLRFKASKDRQTAEGRIAITLSDASPMSSIELALSFPQKHSYKHKERHTRRTPILPGRKTTASIWVNYDLEQGMFLDPVAPATEQRNWGNSDGSWRTELGISPYFTDREYLWHATAPASRSDKKLVTPEFVLGQSEFSLSFLSFFQFEARDEEYSFDGGVIEISINNAPWLDVLDAGGVFTEGDYNSRIASFSNRRAFGGISNSDVEMNRFTVNFGTAHAGSSARIRFRMVSDAGVGDYGWLVDDVSLSGMLMGPFVSLIEDSSVCTNEDGAIIDNVIFCPAGCDAGQHKLDCTQDGGGFLYERPSEYMAPGH